MLSGTGDTTSPVTTAVLNGTTGTNGFFRSPVTVNLSATDVDDAPNTLTTFASVNGGSFVSENAVVLTQDGNYNVNYFSEDPAGNIEGTHTLLVRIDQTPPTVTATANPSTLFPPNHKLVAVTVMGSVADAFSGVTNSIHFQVVDEYGRVQPSGSARVDRNGNYRFVVYLQSSRLGQDRDGRQYTIDVTGQDAAGNQTTVDSTVTVLHDRGQHNGQGSSQGGSTGNHGHKPTNNRGNSGHRNHGNASHQLTGNGNGNQHGHDNSDHNHGGNHGQGHGNKK